MSVDLARLEDRKLSARGQLLLIYMTEKGGWEFICPQDELNSVIRGGKSLWTLRKTISELEELGWITVNRGRLPFSYSVNLTNAKEPPSVRSDNAA